MRGRELAGNRVRSVRSGGEGEDKRRETRDKKGLHWRENARGRLWALMICRRSYAECRIGNSKVYFGFDSRWLAAYAVLLVLVLLLLVAAAAATLDPSKVNHTESPFQPTSPLYNTQVNFRIRIVGIHNSKPTGKSRKDGAEPDG